MGKETYCELLFFLMPFKAEIEILIYVIKHV